MPAMFFMMNLTSIAIIWFGAMRIDAGQMHVGAMMASLQYAIQILFAVFMVTAMFVTLPRAAASAERINEVLDVIPDVNDPPQPRSTGDTRGAMSSSRTSPSSIRARKNRRCGGCRSPRSPEKSRRSSAAPAPASRHSPA